MDFDLIPEDGILQQDITDQFKASTVRTIDSCIEKEKCPDQTAGRLRGQLQWASYREWGKCGRIFQGPLVRQQFYRTEDDLGEGLEETLKFCLLYTSPSPRDQRGSRMPSSA